MNLRLTRHEIDTLREKFRKRPALVHREVQLALDRTGQRIVATMKREGFRGAPSSLAVRTGQLRRGFFANVKMEGNKAKLTVANDTAYARIHEYGGVITAKNRKYLAIPLSAAKTGAGVARFPGGPRSVPDLVFIQRRGRNPLLMRPMGKGKLVPYYVLVRSVKIPARLGMRRTFLKSITGPRSDLQTELRQAVKRVVNG